MQEHLWSASLLLTIFPTHTAMMPDCFWGCHLSTCSRALQDPTFLLLAPPRHIGHVGWKGEQRESPFLFQLNHLAQEFTLLEFASSRCSEKQSKTIQHQIWIPLSLQRFIGKSHWISLMSILYQYFCPANNWKKITLSFNPPDYSCLKNCWEIIGADLFSPLLPSTSKSYTLFYSLTIFKYAKGKKNPQKTPKNTNKKPKKTTQKPHNTNAARSEWLRWRDWNHPH